MKHLARIALHADHTVGIGSVTLGANLMRSIQLFASAADDNTLAQQPAGWQQRLPRA